MLAQVLVPQKIALVLDQGPVKYVIAMQVLLVLVEEYLQRLRVLHASRALILQVD